MNITFLLIIQKDLIIYYYIKKRLKIFSKKNKKNRKIRTHSKLLKEKRFTNFFRTNNIKKLSQNYYRQTITKETISRELNQKICINSNYKQCY